MVIIYNVLREGCLHLLLLSLPITLMIVVFTEHLKSLSLRIAFIIVVFAEYLRLLSLADITAVKN